MTGKQLKNSILQMAVQGKLVPQDPNDEPASVLLERIRKEKEQLVKEGKIKKEKNPSYIFRGADNLPYEKVGKNEPVCIADEVPFDIPETWEWARLKDLAIKEIKRGKSPKYADDSNVYVFAQKCNVKLGRIDISLAKFLDMKTFDKYPVEEYMTDGDIIINSTGNGTLGRIGIFHDSDRINDFVIVPDSHVTIIRAGNQMIEDYLFFALKYHQPYLEKLGEGSTNQTELRPSTVAELFIPVPPIGEQERIVAKLLEVLPMADVYGIKEKALQDYNKDFPIQLKKSILQEAVQGKLVPQDPDDEPAYVLLERIRAEKEQLIKAGKIKRDKHESVIFRRDNSHYEKRGSKEENIDEIIPFELPDSWEWIRLSAILTSTDAGKSPQCENRPRNNGEWGVIKTTAIQDGYFLAEENKVLPLNFNIQESMVVHHGDLLITRAGPRNRTGVICVVDGEPEYLILSDKTVRLSYLRDLVNPYYVMTALSSPAMQYLVIDAMTGMAASQVNISQEKMKTFLLPLPPLNEQQRIVDEVGKIFDRIDKLNF
ncbi:restriction endonuclease subunit S [Candidatus Merdisoma sp. HCP28S3_D10]|uniref:restriction endonuclease subunit S n=1 Tax=Candidatus Merdisoma sp. HCP28S3_D10 TaxID=3438869 RepID=UPI003F89CDC9